MTTGEQSSHSIGRNLFRRKACGSMVMFCYDNASHSCLWVNGLLKSQPASLSLQSEQGRLYCTYTFGKIDEQQLYSHSAIQASGTNFSVTYVYSLVVRSVGSRDSPVDILIVHEYFDEIDNALTVCRTTRYLVMM